MGVGWGEEVHWAADQATHPRCAHPHGPCRKLREPGVTLPRPPTCPGLQLFWEKQLDTKAVIGYNNDTVVIAFRGTASMANVKCDIQVECGGGGSRSGCSCVCTCRCGMRDVAAGVASAPGLVGRIRAACPARLQVWRSRFPEGIGTPFLCS